jgi:curli biogenesis system outer membrane secretion channel CsgG
MSTRIGFAKIAAALLAAAWLWSGTASAAPRGNLRYSVVVDKFENNTGTSRLGDDWGTLLTSALHESGSFIVVAQDDMQLKALKEQLRNMTGTTAQGRKTAQRGHMVPAQLMVKGVITHFQQGTANQDGGIGVGKFKINAGRTKTEIRATLQMIDATTGAIVAAKNFIGIAQQRAFSVQQNGGQQGKVGMGADANVHDALEKAIAEVIPWMVAQLPSVAWRGTIVRVDKGKITINRGSREGVTAEDEFIAGESEILRDPDTGEFLEEVLNERARIKVVQLNDRTAVCTVVNGEPGHIVTGMAIQYSRENR